MLPRSLPLLLVLATGTVEAEELLSEAAFFVNIPEVTSATRMPQKLSEAPASITVIDREVIAASGLQTIPDLMRLVPGFQSYTLNPDTAATSYHGASGEYPNRLEVMVDGRSVYLPLLSTVRWETLGISIHDIARIEVVRGSNVPTQGSNAFLGSINIITHEPTASSGLDLTTLFGSDDTRNGHLSYADSNGLVSYRISANHEQSDGNDHYSEFYTGPWFAPDGSDGNWQDKQSRDYLNLSATWTPDLINSFWLQAGIDRGQSRMGPLDKPDAHFTERDHESTFISGQFNHLYSDTGMLQLQAYTNRLSLETPKASLAEALTELEAGSPTDCGAADLAAFDQLLCGYSLVAERDGVAKAFVDQNNYHLIEEHGVTRSSDIELQINDTLGNFSFAAGLGYRYMSARSKVLLQSGEVEDELSRLFGSGEWTLAPRWSLSSGMMYEYSSESSEAFSYRNALIFKPGRGSSLRLGYSRSERLPSLLERYGESSLYIPAYPGLSDTPILYDRVREANPDLDTEQISSWELGYYQALPNQPGYLDIRIFREEVSDGISSYWVYDPTDPDSRQRFITSRNVAGWTNEGAEMQLRLDLTRDLWALFSYAYLNTNHENWPEGDAGTDKTFFSSKNISPEHTASLLVNWSATPTLDLGLTHYYMSGLEWIDSEELPGYERTDLRLAKQWQIDNTTSIAAALVLQNAFQSNHQDFYEDNQFNRRTFLQLSMRYD